MGHDLRIAAARGSALDSEHGAQRRLPERKAYLFAQLFKTVRKSDGDSRFSLPRRRGVDRRHENELRLPRQAFGQREFGFIFSVQFQFVLGQRKLSRDFAYVFEFRVFRNLDIRQHGFSFVDYIISFTL